MWDKTNDTSVNDPILEVLSQPEDCTVFNQTVVVCTAPPQKWDVVQAIKRKNYELRICAYRPSDNRMSMNSFKFEYLPHVPSDQNQALQGPSGKLTYLKEDLSTYFGYLVSAIESLT